MSKSVHGLAFGIPKNNLTPYSKINQGIVNLSYNCDVNSGLRVRLQYNSVCGMATFGDNHLYPVFLPDATFWYVESQWQSGLKCWHIKQVVRQILQSFSTKTGSTAFSPFHG